MLLILNYSCCFFSSDAVLIVVFISTDQSCWEINNSVFRVVCHICYHMEYPWFQIFDHIYHASDQNINYVCYILNQNICDHGLEFGRKLIKIDFEE